MHRTLIVSGGLLCLAGLGGCSTSDSLITGPSGRLVTVDFVGSWGDSGTGNGQFSSPHSIAVDGSGNLYVTDTGNHRVQKFSSGGAYLTQWGAQGAGDGQFFYPAGVALDAGGNVYVADTANDRIQKFILSAGPDYR